MAKITKMRQCKLQSKDTITVTWLQDDKRLKIGARITLKDSNDPTRLWKILTISEPLERSDIKTAWNVGGI